MAMRVVVSVSVIMYHFGLHLHRGFHGVCRSFRRFRQRRPRGRGCLGDPFPAQVSRQGFVLGKSLRLFPYAA